MEMLLLMPLCLINATKKDDAASSLITKEPDARKKYAQEI
jgi:hypothetical protein